MLGMLFALFILFLIFKLFTLWSHLIVRIIVLAIAIWVSNWVYNTFHTEAVTAAYVFFGTFILITFGMFKWKNRRKDSNKN